MNPALHPVASAPRSTDSSIGGLLLESGKITPESAERVLRMQKELGIRFGEAAQRLGLVTEQDIQQALARQFDYPYLQQGQGKYTELLVAAYQPFSAQVEALRAVRSQLMLRWFARERKSLVIAGVSSGDGASMFAANLAVVFSQLGERTLLVDANLRRPRQHQVFDLQGRQGLSDALAGRADQGVIEKIEPFMSLSVLGAGTLPPNPQELLSRPVFADLNRELEAQYDIVLYDGAAFGDGSDSMALAARIGGVLLVLHRHHTRIRDVNATVAMLRRNGTEVVGTIMVDFP
ncbi:chain length determinant protein tyrosine kinase EpsG [Rugamonas fusca]|nr:chain length determinant protein tyrosine kinase EpsG [Rugamonas fusca]